MVFGLGSHLETAGHFPNGDAVFGLFVFRHQLGDQRPNSFARLPNAGG